MAEFTGGELVARVLKQARVGHVFTLCGGHILPIPTDYVHRTPTAGDPSAIERLAQLLAGAARPVVMAGGGVYWDDGMEMETAGRFGLPITCIIGNAGWGQIRNPQLSFFGEERAVATSLPTTRFDLMVEALGGCGVLVREPKEIGPALERALNSNEVWCINVPLDPAAYRRTGQVSMAI